MNEVEKGIVDLLDKLKSTEAELAEARMQSLAHQGQAADALEAQKKAEAERDALKAEVEAWRDCFKYSGFDGTSIVMSG
jgi:chromosome segregation ATPase